MQMYTIYFSLYFIPYLRTDNYLLVAGDQTSPRKKMIKRALVGLLKKLYQEEADRVD